MYIEDTSDEVFFSTPYGEKIHILHHETDSYNEFHYKYSAYCGVSCADYNAVTYHPIYMRSARQDQLCPRCFKLRSVSRK